MKTDSLRQFPKRVFINCVDSYASKCIAKFLSECVLGAFADPDGENEEEGRMSSPDDAATAFQAVGTVSEKSGEDGPHVLEEYFRLGRDELLLKLMTCDVVIYNITQHTDQVEEALWAVSALHNKMELFSKPKMFILISTVMTWARSRPVNPLDMTEPFTEIHGWRRRAHPNFIDHINLEKKVVKMGKTNRRLFSTYVVASGLQYGMGEQIFHYFFKTSWLGQQEIPVFGDGHNIVSTIHINDLASVIQNVIQHQPQTYYFLAVDNSNNTLEDIVKAVASVLGTGKIQKRPEGEAFLTRELSQVRDCDSILANLCMKSVLIKELFSVSWVCESGLVDNIELVVAEYRHTRGLMPIRLCVLGPPAVGKSTVSKEICNHYQLHHITVKATISETTAQLKDAVEDFDPNAENEDSAAEAQELLNSIKESMEQNGGLLDDQLLVKVVKDKLMSNPCRNQGFVLDGFPKTYEQAKELFSADEYESDDGTTTFNKKIIPGLWLVLCLDASDAFLKDRVMNLPERLVEEHNYEHGHFLRSLARFRENNVEDQTVLNYFDELAINPLYLEITSNGKRDCLLLMQKIFDMLGKPRNYGPSIHETQEGDRRKAEEKMRREAQMRTAEEQREVEEAMQRAARWEEWTTELGKQRQQEEELLEAQTVSMRSYLLEHVMPTLTRGLTECFRVQPEDPVDFLAEYMFKNNPGNY